MLWLILGLICAFFYALYHLANKKYIKNADATYFAFCGILMTAIITLPLLPLLWSRFVFNWTVIISFFIVGIMVVITRQLYMHSIKIEDVSITTPLLTITPLFTLILGMVWIKEFPSYIGIIGIVLLVTGTYFLNYKRRKDGLLEPFKLIFRNKGSLYMFIVAFIFGIGSIMDKFIINNSNYITHVLIYNYFVIPVFVAYLLFKEKPSSFISKTKNIFKTNWKGLLITTLIYFGVMLSYVIAISLTYTVYIISLKRVSAIFTIIMAYFLFKEKKNFWHILFGTVLMVLGVVLIVI
ncbi:EamA family transporter [Candidatus Woesearchaeota archaeon]|nr:EamA family transporter [Candidatus Woesearchaeota archaeon]